MTFTFNVRVNIPDTVATKQEVRAISSTRSPTHGWQNAYLTCPLEGITSSQLTELIGVGAVSLLANPHTGFRDTLKLGHLEPLKLALEAAWAEIEEVRKGDTNG